MNTIHDYGYSERMNWLIELIELRGNKSPRKLLKEALNMYPLYYTSTQRSWLSINTYNKAIGIMEQRK